MTDFELVKAFTDAHNPAIQGSVTADAMILGLRNVATKAAAAERERCAGIFDARAKEWRSNWLHTSMDDGEANASFKAAMLREEANAAAIRKAGK